MKRLPSGWRRTTLGQLGQYWNGRGFKKSEWRETGLPIIRIQNLTGSSASFNHFDGQPEKRYIVQRGDLLVSWAATLGAYIWNGPEAVVNQHIFKVESFVDTRLHKYVLDHKLDELMRETHGSGIIHVTRSRFNGIPVLIPDSDAEQRRIVELLDDHLSRLDAGQSLLRSTASKVMAADWSWLRENLGSPPAAECLPLADCLQSIRGGWSRSSRHLIPAGSGTPYLKMNNIAVAGTLDLGDVVYVDTSAEDLDRYGIRPGDVLFNSKNSRELVGKTAVATDGVQGWVFNENIMRLRFDGHILPAFVNLWFRSPVFRSHLESAVSASTNVAAVYQGALVKMPLWVPSLSIQRDLVDRHEVLTSAASHLLGAVERQSRRSVQLRRVLLEAAFSGQLTGRASDVDRVEELVEASA